MKTADLVALRSEAETQFNELDRQRNELLAQAEQIAVEMSRLQGEYRAYDKLVDDSNTNVNKKQADLIEVVPEKEK